MFETLVAQMKEAESVIEQLKEDNQMDWVCRMQNIEAKASDIIFYDLIYI